MTTGKDHIIKSYDSELARLDEAFAGLRRRIEG